MTDSNLTYALRDMLERQIVEGGRCDRRYKPRTQMKNGKRVCVKNVKAVRKPAKRRAVKNPRVPLGVRNPMLCDMRYNPEVYYNQDLDKYNCIKYKKGVKPSPNWLPENERGNFLGYDNQGVSMYSGNGFEGGDDGGIIGCDRRRKPMTYKKGNKRYCYKYKEGYGPVSKAKRPATRKQMTAAAKNPWLIHLKKVRKANKNSNLDGKQIMQLASETYCNKKTGKGRAC